MRKATFIPSSINMEFLTFLVACCMAILATMTTTNLELRMSRSNTSQISTIGD